MNRDEKAAAVSEISSSLKDAGSVFAFDYRGISVAEGAELRTQLREADTTFKVVKNRLAKRAVSENDGSSELEELLSGPTAIAFVNGDPVVAAKALATFARDHGVPTFKGGLMDGEPLDADSFSAIALLPGIDVLYGQLVGLAASPITSLARGLGQMIGGLAQQLNQIAEQGLVTGTPPEPEPESESAPPDSEAAAEPEAAAPEAEAQPSEPEDQGDPVDETSKAGPVASEGDATPAAGPDVDVKPDPEVPGTDSEAPTSAGTVDDSEAEGDPVAPGGEAEEATGNEKENES